MSFAPAIAGFVAGASLIIAIGAQNAFVLRQGLKRENVGLVVAVCAFGDIALITAGVGGLGALVQSFPWLLQVLRFGGAAFLGVYGLMAARRAWEGSGGLAPSDAGRMDWRHTLLACLAFTFLNPHVYLDTMILLGSLANNYAGASRWVFALGACIASVTWFTTVGFGARLLQPVFRRPLAWRVLDGFVAVFMLVLCIVLLVTPLRS